MNPELSFSIATAGGIALPALLAIAIASLPRPKRLPVRVAIAILLSWAVGIAYTIYIYNLAGISAGHALGQDSPEMRFDNNTVAVQMFMGWLYPTIAVALLLATRRWARNRAIKRS